MRMQLFKIRVYPEQDPKGTVPMGTDSLDRSQIIRDRISAMPCCEPFYGAVWHIHNIEQIGDAGLMFAIGRELQEEAPHFDEDRGFVTEPTEVSPYTVALLDLQTCWLGIVPNRDVAQTPLDIAKRLERLLTLGEPKSVPPLRFSVKDVKAPTRFLNYLSTAYRIRRLTLKVGPSNPIDANELFQRPFSRLVSEAGADSGEATLAGDSLDAEAAVDLVRSVSATGDDASATVQMKKDGANKRVYLKANPASIDVPDISTPMGREEAISLIRAEYRNIRQGESDEAER